MKVTRRFVESVGRGTVRSDIKGHLDTWRLDHRRLAVTPEQSSGTRSSERINQIASYPASATAYLEIGIEHGYTLEAVKISTKVGVDPHPLFSLKSLPVGVTVHSLESDRFFETLSDDVKFDIIFLDGFHTYQQTYRDLMNSLHHLVANGVIIIDDVVPSDEMSAIPELEVSISQQVENGVTDFRWHGDVFRLIPLLRDHHPELRFRTLVGSGNEQTLLWKVDPFLESRSVDESTVAAYAQVSYEDMFANGVPGFFGPGSDENIFKEVNLFREAR